MRERISCPLGTRFEAWMARPWFGVASPTPLCPLPPSPPPFPSLLAFEIEADAHKDVDTAGAMRSTTYPPFFQKQTLPRT